MKISVPIYNRSKKYGYIYWRKEEDYLLSSLLGKLASVDVIFQGEKLGPKNIDWKYRRISIGWRLTRPLDIKYKQFSLKLSEDNILNVVCI